MAVWRTNPKERLPGVPREDVIPDNETTRIHHHCPCGAVGEYVALEPIVVAEHVVESEATPSNSVAAYYSAVGVLEVHPVADQGDPAVGNGDPLRIVQVDAIAGLTLREALWAFDVQAPQGDIPNLSQVDPEQNIPDLQILERGRNRPRS